MAEVNNPAGCEQFPLCEHLKTIVSDPPANVLFLRLTELQSKGKSACGRCPYLKPKEKPPTEPGYLITPRRDCDCGYERPSLRAVGSTSRKPGVLGYRILRRTVQVRLGSNPLRLPDGTPFSTVSRQQFVKYLGLSNPSYTPCCLPASAKWWFYGLT
jgi:hypothetical protein